MSIAEGLHPGPRRPRRAVPEDVLAPALGVAKRHRVAGAMLGVGGAIALHLGAVTLFASVVGHAHAAPPDPTMEIQIEAPPPPPRPKPAPPTPDPKVAAPREAPAAAPAQAGKVLTQAPDRQAPVDMTDQGFVNGNGDSFAGGQTAADGTSKTAVGSIRPEPAHLERTQAPPPPPPKPDLSRAAMPTSLAWNCGFPPEDDDVDHAAVVIVVSVAPDGRPRGARVTSDPGHGFGRVARQCAMGMRYRPGLDRDGNPTTTATPPFVVRFNR